MLFVVASRVGFFLNRSTTQRRAGCGMLFALWLWNDPMSLSSIRVATSNTWDVSLIPKLGGLATNVIRIIGFVSTQVMHTIGRLGFLDRHRLQRSDGILRFMSIGGRDRHTQRRTTRVHQHMPFGALFAAIRRVGAGVLATQRRSHALGIQRLPAPLNALQPLIQLQHQSKHPPPHTLLAPRLEARMDTASSTQPSRLQRLPLAASTQHIHHALIHLLIAQRRSSNATVRLRRR